MMPLGCPVARESRSTFMRYLGILGWELCGGTELAAATVRVDPSALVSAVYTQTVQWSRWLNSRWL
jgi:hypothetical protein